MVAESSCASEGVVEVLVEPQVPRLLVIVDSSAAAIRCGACSDDRLAGDDRADRGCGRRGRRDDGPCRRGGLGGGSRRPGGGTSDSWRVPGAPESCSAALRERGLGKEQQARVHSPAGLDLGPATQPEIAVAILAELVAWRHTHHIHAGGESVLEAVDPVCGMTVAVDAAGDAVVRRRELPLLLRWLP